MKNSNGHNYILDINRLCTSNSDCISPNSYCGFLYEDCTVGECRCTSGYYFASDFTCREGIR